MPPIRSVSCGAAVDGFEIVTSLLAKFDAGALRLTRNGVPANVRNKTPAEVEAWVNAWLEEQLGEPMTDAGDPMFGRTWYPFHASVVVHSTNPLSVTVTCTNGGWV